MVTCSRAGYARIRHSKSQLTLSGVTYPPGSHGLISITFVAKTSFTKPDMKRHCTAINETSNKKKHIEGVWGGGLLNLETIRRAVHRTTVFGERLSRSPLHNDLLYHFLYMLYWSCGLQPYSITAAKEDEDEDVNRKSFRSQCEETIRYQ